jgi:hypothetical protein
LFSGLYLNVLVDNVLAGEAILFLHIFRVAEYTVASVEVVVRPPKREIKISHYVGLNIIKYNLPTVSSAAASPGETHRQLICGQSPELYRQAAAATADSPGGIAGS